MSALKQFLMTGLIRLGRSKTDLLLLIASPFIIIGIMVMAGLPHSYFSLLILLMPGTQLLVTTGYDYGRSVETGALYRLLVSGVSPVILFIGINSSRLGAYLLSGGILTVLGIACRIRFDPVVLLYTLAGAGIIYAALGLCLYRLLNNALAVLSTGPIVLFILALPALAAQQHRPVWVDCLSPVSVLFAANTHTGFIFIGCSLLWILLAVTAIYFLVIRKKRG